MVDDQLIGEAMNYDLTKRVGASRHPSTKKSASPPASKHPNLTDSTHRTNRDVEAPSRCRQPPEYASSRMWGMSSSEV